MSPTFSCKTLLKPNNKLLCYLINKHKDKIIKYDNYDSFLEYKDD